MPEKEDSIQKEGNQKPKSERRNFWDKAIFVLLLLLFIFGVYLVMNKVPVCFNSPLTYGARNYKQNGHLDDVSCSCVLSKGALNHIILFNDTGINNCNDDQGLCFQQSMKGGLENESRR